MKMISTTYIHQKLEYFFSASQIIDIELGLKQNYSLSKCMDILEEGNIINRQRTMDLLAASLSLQKIILCSSNLNSFTFNSTNIKKFIDLGGLKISLIALQNYISELQKKKVGISQQMTLKVLFNLFYISLFWLYNQSKLCKTIFQQLQNFLIQMEVDYFLIKLVTMTLQVHYLPIKKLIILYTRVLSVLFDSPELYLDSQLFTMANQNLLPEDYLKKFKQNNQPTDVIAGPCPIKKFYAKHNVGDCPLAQSIVVGLLRSLLTICNSQTHKKFSGNNTNSGVDSYRQWQLTYHFLECYPTYKKNLSQRSMDMIQNYKKYNEQASNQSATHYQFYSHKVYTTSSITTFFSLLLASFKKSVFIHFTYLYQLIADANGILVFLKFLTDKFQVLKIPEIYSIENKQITFQNQVMLTVYSVLLVLYGACNNYPQKARSYLFEYNSYLIIKKIPHLFMKSHKHDEELPSNQQIQEQFGSTQRLNPVTLKVKQLTVLCYDLLKIQIPFFSKKSKQSSNNMRMIVQIYCQLPKDTQPIKRTQLQKILLKNKMKKNASQKYIRSIEQLKTIHNEYNNAYYWANDSLDTLKNKTTNKVPGQQPILMNKQAMQKWLQDNVWKYFD